MNQGREGEGIERRCGVASYEDAGIRERGHRVGAAGIARGGDRAGRRTTLSVGLLIKRASRTMDGALGGPRSGS
jgi:hypothetical protein